MINDPISDLLTRIRNAQRQKHRYVDIPLSKQKLNIAKVLEQHGFIKSIVVNEEKKVIRLMLKYGPQLKPVINGLKRISKPGLRKFIGYQDIPKILGGLGIAVLSTNRGVIEGETAREQKLGGELLCYIW